MSNYIINNIKDRYDIRYKLNKMINLKLRKIYNNSLNLYGNLNAFFIFINLFYKKNITTQFEIFDNNCEIYINNIKISLFLFFKKLILEFFSNIGNPKLATLSVNGIKLNVSFLSSIFVFKFSKILFIQNSQLSTAMIFFILF